MKLSKHFPPITQEEEDAYLEDKIFAHLNGYTEWELSIPSYTLFQALSVFPEAKPIVKKELEAEKKEIQDAIEALQDSWTEQKNAIHATERNYHKAIERIAEITEATEREREGLEDKLKRVQFNLDIFTKKDSYIQEWTQKVEQAKQVPIPTLMQFRNGKAKCIWHNENHDSLQYYPDTNRAHCFGCGKNEDAIGVMMKLNECTFSEAVKKLVV